MIYHQCPSFAGIVYLQSVGTTLLEIELRWPNSVATRVSKNTTATTNRCANVLKNEDVYVYMYVYIYISVCVRNNMQYIYIYIHARIYNN